MGKSSAKAPPPDPAVGQAAVMNAQLGQAWLDFSKQQFASGEGRQDQYDKLIKRVVDNELAQQGIQNQYQQKMFGYQDEQMAMAKEAQGKANAFADKQLEMADYQFAQGKEQDAYNKATFRPVEQKMVNEAMNYDSAERQESMAAEAKADVMDAAARAKATNERNMASMGVNPASGRFAGVSRATDTATALSAAGAQNKARNDVRQMGIMLRKDAANYSKGMASTAAQSFGIGMQAGANGVSAANPTGLSSLALQAGAAGAGAGATGAQIGSSAVSNFGAGQNNFYANNGVMGQGFTGAMQGYANMGNILNTQYGNQLNAWAASNQAKAQSSAGWGSALGTIAGAGIKLLSSKEAKTDKRPVDGALDAINGMPVEKWRYKDGMGDEGEHIGPYAEDFQAATGKGDGQTIPVVDAIGVTMKAVQELDKKVDALARRKGATR